MSITDVDAPSSYGPPSGPGESFDRTPPQDVAAEQSVLGGMMLSKDAIADVVEVLRGNDFYRPAHELIYDAILDLYGRGEPADAVTVSDELNKRGDHAPGRRRAVPAHAHLVGADGRERRASTRGSCASARCCGGWSTRGRRSSSSATRPTGGDVDDIVNAAQAEVYAVTERRTSEDYLPIGQIIEPTVDEIEAAGHRGEGMIGVPTGFSDLDRLTNGLHPGQMIVLAASPAIGKSHDGTRHRPVGVHQERPDLGDLLARDEPHRDHHAHAQRRGAHPAAEAAPGPARGQRLDQDGPHDGRAVRRAAVHRRQPEHVADGDPGQVPPAQAAPRPQGRDHRLPAADVQRQARRVPPAGGLGVLPCAEAAGQGARGPGHRDQPAEPWPRAAHRQAPADERPSRVGHRSSRMPTW